MNRGHFAALGAFSLWGLLPIYWKALDHVPALQITAHRLAWCCIWVVAFLFVTRGRAWLRPLLSQPAVMRNLTLSALLIGVNWFLYIWAVNAGHIVEASLGYFINPLINVLFGVVIFKERLNTAQWTAVALAAAGVAYMTLSHGRLPWIALTLAMSFGLYSVVRKATPVESVPGLAWESAIFFPLVVVYLLWVDQAGDGHFLRIAPFTDWMLIGGGAATAVPLICFAFAARRVPLSVIGVMQYMAPTTQLLIGVLVYGEAFTGVEAVGFGCIWSGLLVYTVDGLRRQMRTRRAAKLARAQGEPT